jgi:membrane protease YdiL (CAAX protease family)
MRKQLGFLTPGSRLELAAWFGLSATAGFCEEIIFRGYLQRQLAALGKSMLLGVLLSAAVFGASHGYEGAARMLLIGIFGLMFGFLA